MRLVILKYLGIFAVLVLLNLWLATKRQERTHFRQMLQSKLAHENNSTAASEELDSHTKSTSTISPTGKDIVVKYTKRIVVTSYLPKGEHGVLQFITFLFTSWQFVVAHEKDFYKEGETNEFMSIDILIFCHPENCPKLPKECKPYDIHKVKNAKERNCWKFEQNFESKIKYGPINSYVMFNRTDAEEIFSPYDRILRTDYDVFITPMLLTWKLRKPILFGQGGYCDPFNMKRLKQIAAKLGMRHQSVHCIGSTWYGETEIFIKCCRKAYIMTEHMFLNEFDPRLPGLEVIPFFKNIEGEWIRWWRPVSSMYGGELAANDVVDKLSILYKGTFDTSSCSKESYTTTPHIHCWHDNCEFQKFIFMNSLTAAIHSNGHIPGNVVHRLVENSYDRNIQNMSVNEYSTYIAWRGVRENLKGWFL